MAEKTGSETMGAAGDKGKMTLFRDDRQEDVGAIIVAAIVIATIMVMTMSKAPAPAPAAPAVVPTSGAAPVTPAPAK